MMHPVEAISSLERMLRGVKIDEPSIRKAVNLFYHEEAVTTPGATSKDFITAIISAVSKTLPN